MAFSGYESSQLLDVIKLAGSSFSDAVAAYIENAVTARTNADTNRAVALLNAAEAESDSETARTLRDEAYQILLP